MLIALSRRSRDCDLIFDCIALLKLFMVALVPRLFEVGREVRLPDVALAIVYLLLLISLSKNLLILCF